MHLSRFILLILLFLNLAFSGYVYGEIYSYTFEKLDSAVIKIEGSFSYQFVAHSSNYSIHLPEGEYKISASSYNEQGNLELYAEEEINVGEENQRIDLILTPVINLYYLLGIGIIILIIIAAILIKLRRTPAPKSMEPEQKQEVKKSLSLDEDAKKVLQALESFEGRATQKEIKETLNFSDAKLSLILTELEEYDYIKKFKRGRGNIIKKIK